MTVIDHLKYPCVLDYLVKALDNNYWYSKETKNLSIDNEMPQILILSKRKNKRVLYSALFNGLKYF